MVGTTWCWFFCSASPSRSLIQWQAGLPDNSSDSNVCLTILTQGVRDCRILEALGPLFYFLITEKVIIYLPLFLFMNSLYKNLTSHTLLTVFSSSNTIGGRRKFIVSFYHTVNLIEVEYHGWEFNITDGTLKPWNCL